MRLDDAGDGGPWSATNAQFNSYFRKSSPGWTPGAIYYTHTSRTPTTSEYQHSDRAAISQSA